ncbi:MAG: response regulator [Candidatus Brocadiia bacterium]
MKHVMVIDDERDILTCLHEALSAEGYRVTAAVSGAEALDVLEDAAPDLVILDLRMPDMNGIEVLQAIRRDRPELPVIVCSALSSYRNDFDIVSSNVAAFIDKPIDLDKLSQAVRQAIGGGTTELVFPPEDADPEAS